MGTGCVIEYSSVLLSPDIDACLARPCHANATCEDNAAPSLDATCTCDMGFEGDGLTSGTGCTGTTPSQVPTGLIFRRISKDVGSQLPFPSTTASLNDFSCHHFQTSMSAWVVRVTPKPSVQI